MSFDSPPVAVATPNGVSPEVPVAIAFPSPREPEAAVVTGATSGPRLPRREVWIDLPPEYEGCRIKVWVNYPRRLNDELASQETERVSRALRQIVVEHNSWSESDGTPLPSATTPEFWQAISDELAATIIILVREQVGKLATSLTTRSGR